MCLDPQAGHCLVLNAPPPSAICTSCRREMSISCFIRNFDRISRCVINLPVLGYNFGLIFLGHLLGMEDSIKRRVGQQYKRVHTFGSFSSVDLVVGARSTGIAEGTARTRPPGLHFPVALLRCSQHMRDRLSSVPVVGCS